MPGFITSIVTTVAIAIIIPIVFNVFYFFKLREEKKHKYDKEAIVRTYAPKVYRLFFLVVAIILFVATVAGAIILIVNREGLYVILVVVIVGSLFTLLGLFGYLITALNYEIIDNDKIIVVRCFTKRRIVDIGSISCYKFNPGFLGGLVAFDKNGISLFESSGYNVNIEKIVQKLDENFIPKARDNYPSNALKDTPVYKRYSKKHNLKIFAWLFLGFGLATFAIAALMFPQLHYTEFENYAVNGVISEYELKDNSATIHLADDENIYRINNIVYNKLDSSFAYTIKVGKSVEILVGYTDDSERRIVSQIAIDGTVYLDKTESEKAEYENYNELIVFGYVIIGIGSALLIAWLPCLICSTKIKVYEE